MLERNTISAGGNAGRFDFGEARQLNARRGA